MRQASLTLLVYGVVVALRASISETMLHEVGIIDPESFWDASNPLTSRLLLGWSVLEADGDVALVSGRPRRGC